MNSLPALSTSKAFRFSLLASLYIAQGLPYAFFVQGLPVMMREAGYSLKAISLAGLMQIPWACKFLWASFVDQRGTAKQWLLTLQFAAVSGALILSQMTYGGFTLLLFGAFLFSVLAATQDIVTDGLAVRLLDARDRGVGNGIQVGAYRVGMILGGGLLLAIYASSDWPTTFLWMGLLLGATIPLVLRLPPIARTTERHERARFRTLALGWWSRLHRPGMLTLMALIIAYRFGDSMVATLVGPFLKDSGLSMTNIAVMRGTLGSAASVVGAICGGWLAYRWHRRAVLLSCGLAQSASLLLYVAAAMRVGGESMFWAAVIGEHVLGTLATVALFTVMMDAADPEHAGTDYTLLASVPPLVQFLANLIGAAIADEFGYAPTFALGFFLSLLGCVAVVRTLDRSVLPGRLAEVWTHRRPATRSLA